MKPIIQYIPGYDWGKAEDPYYPWPFNLARALWAPAGARDLSITVRAKCNGHTRDFQLDLREAFNVLRQTMLGGVQHLQPQSRELSDECRELVELWLANPTSEGRPGIHRVALSGPSEWERYNGRVLALYAHDALFHLVTAHRSIEQLDGSMAAQHLRGAALCVCEVQPESQPLQPLEDSLGITEWAEEVWALEASETTAS
ncbi:MAG: hypothetical protein CMH57_02470 [Myxococcales bacterium]|nr:hypothetical protein [Myxococcales bacterium]